MAGQINLLDSREGLLGELAALDVEGWGGGRGERLLTYVRVHIVRPQVFAAGFRGPAAAQAEATGWEVAWEALNSRGIRDADSPWGWLWVAVRRAVHGELMAATYLTSARKGESTRQQGRGVDRKPHHDPPLSLTRLVEKGWERAEDLPVRRELGWRLEAVVAALMCVGWESRSASAVVEGVAHTAARDGKVSAEARGWRPLALNLGLPPWQVRRVMVLLLGAPNWPGVMERMAGEGVAVLDEPDMRAALRSTLSSSWPTPVLAARRASSASGRQPILAAS